MSSDESTDLGVLLNLAFVSFRQALDADLAAHGYPDLGPSYGYVFRRLAEGGCSLSVLARHLSMTAPGALKLVNEMVERGYVERIDHLSDGRVKLLQLTAKGRKALRQARDFHQRYERTLSGRLGAKAVTAARSVLEEIVNTTPQTGLTKLPRPA